MGCVNSQQGPKTSNGYLWDSAVETRRRSIRRSHKDSGMVSCGDSQVQKSTSLKDSMMVKMSSLRSGGGDPVASTTSVPKRHSHRELRGGVKPRVSFTEGKAQHHADGSSDTQRFGCRTPGYSSERRFSEVEEIPVEICSASADPLVARVKVMELERARCGPSSKCSVVVKKGCIEIWSTWSTRREEVIPLKDLKEMEITNGNVLMIKIIQRKKERFVELFADGFEEARKWYEAIEHGLKSMSMPMEYSLCQMEVTASYLPEFQRLVDHCFIKKATRDRKGGHLPKGLKVVSVVRVDNWTLFDNYSKQKSQIADQLTDSDRQESKRILNPDVRTKGLEPPMEVLMELDEGTIERWLFHGTSPDGLEGISQSHFDLSRAGSGAGEMYGKGIYCADCSSKADEYTEPFPNGIRGLLLCRASLGKILYSDAKSPNAKELQHEKAVRKCHTILGDRWKAVGTYREYIFGRKEQLYPEFIIYYRRVH